MCLDFVMIGRAGHPLATYLSPAGHSPMDTRRQPSRYTPPASAVPPLTHPHACSPVTPSLLLRPGPAAPAQPREARPAAVVPPPAGRQWVTGTPELFTLRLLRISRVGERRTHCDRHRASMDCLHPASNRRIYTHGNWRQNWKRRGIQGQGG